MTYQLLTDAWLAIAFFSFMALLVVIDIYWYRHYSSHAKSLKGRLKAIVSMRSHADDRLIKSEESQYAAFQKIALTMQLTESVRLMIQRSSIKISVFRFVMITFGIVLSSMLVLAFFTQLSLFSLVAFSVALGALPSLYVKQREQKRRSQIEKQLPEALDFICRSLRVGHPLVASFKIVGNELSNPLAQEFKQLFEEINFSLPFNVAMSNFVSRTNSNEINFLVVGLMIQHETGGNLIELLENLAKTLRDRTIINGKIRVLASEGKSSGLLLCILPFFLGGILSLLNPTYMSLLWTTESGEFLILFSLLLMTIGAIWMWKITKIRV